MDALTAALGMPEDEINIDAFLRKVATTAEEIGTAQHLKWSALDLDDDDLKAVAKLASGMFCLRTLDLRCNAIGDDGLARLAAALRHLPALSDLMLADNQIGDDGLAALSTALSNGALPALTHLFLEENQLGDAGMLSFAAALSSRGALQELHITHPTRLGAISYDLIADPHVIIAE